ncbi:1,4-dihydroxy-2-naphthoate polyprenyltransferase [Propioniciclava soli]|uniref:1,4-dihydroxy-2-naphthoate polyprenyltransferase n=1 Tax=Propioniciclava soli TaxID=2775081 RepID=UPI001E3DF2D4|nr:1,4-dihydroxy-2-naphthoate polyprenyltransferase [Propioniciclava soli]
MATAGQWLEGARLRTLPAAVAPVVVGSAVALWAGGWRPGHAVLALVVALALQVGVNFANDYSDGMRGTDDARVGPQRLVGSGAAPAAVVKAAAFGCFGVAALAGLALVVLTSAWWLLAVGAVCILAAWFYTGGRRPYGYAGLGELFVFVFFGLVATCGTTYVQLGEVPAASVWGGVACGALASAILVANNLRDRAGDAVAGKRTLAVRLGERWTRWLYVALVGVGVFAVVQVAATSTWWALLGLVMVVLLAGPVRLVLLGAVGPELVRVLKLTGLGELAGALGVLLGCLVGAL